MGFTVRYYYVFFPSPPPLYTNYKFRSESNLRIEIVLRNKRKKYSEISDGCFRKINKSFFTYIRFHKNRIFIDVRTHCGE